MEEPPVNFLTASIASGIPIEAKRAPTPFPACFCVTLKFRSLGRLCAAARSLFCFDVHRLDI